MTSLDDVMEGAKNLLVNCARLEKGERLLVVREDSRLGWYDDRASQAVIDLARQMGIEPKILEVGGPQASVGAAITEAIRDHDCTIFFARIGDQERFCELPSGCRSVMVYARDAASLGSSFGRTNHHAMTDLKQAINELFANAEDINITCPLGTQLSGKPDLGGQLEPADVTVSRFPLGVPAPVLTKGFSGRVAITHYLTTTGSKPYEPASLPIKGVVFAEVTHGRIKQFSGEPTVVGQIENHYRHVANLYDIDRNAIHSWHAGIHPGCGYAGKISDDPDRWSNNIFCNPRYLHFHTCGDYAPGEICWMVRDPTISIDGVNLWEDGRLLPSRFELTSRCLVKWSVLEHLMAHPEKQLGEL